MSSMRAVGCDQEDAAIAPTSARTHASNRPEYLETAQPQSSRTQTPATCAEVHNADIASTTSGD
eukprot:7429329-Pyramimonas_sp.AAC.1